MKVNTRKLAKRIAEMGEARGINVCQRDEEKMEKAVRALLLDIKYDEGEQQKMIKKDWKHALRRHMIIASALTTGALAFMGFADQALAGGHN
jgi:type VI protein secretion system component VasF